MADKRSSGTDPLRNQGGGNEMKYMPGQTDPLEKWQPSQTDALQKVVPSQTDPLAKFQPGQTDPLSAGHQTPGSDVMLNPQPLPPGGGGPDETIGIHYGKAKYPYTKQQDGGGGAGEIHMDKYGRVKAKFRWDRLGGALGILLLLGLIGGGAVYLLPKFHLNGGATFSPGVYGWEDQGNSTIGSGQGQTGGGPEMATACRKAGGDPVEHLIGGGFDIQGGSDPTIANPNNSTNPEKWLLHLTSGKGTSYAICLREPAAFFSPANAVDYVTSPVAKFNDNISHVSADATCPSGESILGGGYAIGGAILSNEPVLVSSAYPIVDGGGARWHVDAATPSPYSGPTIQAFAICSGTMKTHLEHTGMKVLPADPITFAAEGAAPCSSGTLLTGGFHATDGDKDLGLDVHIQTSAPGKTLKQNSVSGDTFTDWNVVLNGVSQASKAKSVTSDVWVVCWDPTGQGQPTQTTQGVPTATTAPQPTDTPRAQPTPTNTSAPQCQVFFSDPGVTLNFAANRYLNLDNGSASDSQTNMQLDTVLPTGGHGFTGINGTALADLGTGANFNNETCAQLEGLQYSGNTIPIQDGDVFAAKLSDGHYVKVKVSQPVGGPPSPTIQWVTYKP